MSDEELSEDELNALISDLESRSDGEGAGSADLDAQGEESEDIEAFLQEIEQQEDSAGDESATTTASREQQAGPDLSDLEGADELPVESGAEKPAADQSEKDGGAEKGQQEAKQTDEKAAEATGADAGEQKASGGESASEAWRFVWLAAKWTGYALPVLAFWWVLGSFLGQWVSAGWLIMTVVSVFVVGVPKVLYDLSNRRGKFRWWLAGVSLVLTTGLVAPMPSTAGSVLAKYGHWPATTAGEIGGWTGGVLIDANASAGEWMGRQLNPQLPAEVGQTKLGVRETTATADSP